MRYIVYLVLVSSALAADHSCLILAAAPPPTGIATWSRAGKAAQHALIYVAGEYPSGFAFRSQIKDKDVDKIKAKGAPVIILDSQYTRADLDAAKQQCALTAQPPPAAPASTTHEK
jgi:hypothetical protein